MISLPRSLSLPLLMAFMNIITGGYTQDDTVAPLADEDAGSSWSYDDIPAWGNINPVCNNGTRQSPINLTPNGLINIPPAPIVFNNYNVPLAGRVTVHNNGHSVEMEIPVTENGLPATISGGILRSQYEAIGLHFHWGSPGIRGSEHTINRRRYDVELHIVHRRANYTMEQALQNPDGLAVLGIMLEITTNPRRFAPGLNKIFNRLPAVVEYDTRAAIIGRISLAQVLGDLNTRSFYTYKGSLTTPPCAETVTFIIFPDAFPVTYNQVSRFFEILDENNEYLVENFRPLQNRNGRPIYYRDGKLPIILPPLPPILGPILGK